jgi:NAD(P)-dependent dehydrogenase (short-subunit alcohol dehydrogenase family)
MDERCIGFVFVWPAALQQITKCLACDWAKDHIRVNCVAPFWTRIPVKFAQQVRQQQRLSLHCAVYFPRQGMEMMG